MSVENIATLDATTLTIDDACYTLDGSYICDPAGKPIIDTEELNIEVAVVEI